MKKALFLAVAVALLAAPAFGAITNTKHDLSSASSDGGINGTATEICVYCHTPHGAAGIGPLWNRGTVLPVISAVYNNSSLDVSPTTGIAQNSDAPLCLTCHDAGTLTGTLNNPPNSGGGNPVSGFSNNNLIIGTDLANDHPVGFVYAASAEINDAAVTLRATFGNAGNEFWCSSCHDVHDDTNGLFLYMNNAGSALCKDCHNK